MKLGGQTRNAMEQFSETMTLEGHLHDFIDVASLGGVTEPNMTPLYKEI